MSVPPYRDLRSDFFRTYFEKAVPYEDYLKSGSDNHRERWLNYAAKIKLSPSQIERVKSFHRKMPVLVMSGIWCGDCMRQGPMLRVLELANPRIEMRYIDNKENPPLQDELRINGAEKVPVIVTFSEDFYELSRFGDRHRSVYLRKMQTEVGAACDPGLGAPGTELDQELEEWVQHFERMQAIVRLSPQLRQRYGD